MTETDVRMKTFGPIDGIRQASTSQPHHGAVS